MFSSQSSEEENWEHVALVYDGAELSLYVDSELIEVTPLTGIDLPTDCLC